MTGQDQNLAGWLRAAAGSDAVARGRAAEALGEAGGQEARAALGRLLEDADPVVRFKSAVVLARRGDGRGVPAILWGLERTELCALALDALLFLESPPVRQQLKRFFRRWRLHPIERALAAGVLHRCGDEEETRHLERCLRSSRPEERGMAIELYGRLELPGALDVLQDILSNPHETHRLDAARGLIWLADKRSLPLLRRLAREDDAELAYLAREAMAAIEENG